MRSTIKSKKDVERLFSRGRRSTSSSMTVLVGKSDTPNVGRCAFIAGKKLGSAPLRSRCKRVMREVARELGAPWRGYDVVFLARKSVAYENHDEVVRQAKKNLARLGIVDERT